MAATNQQTLIDNVYNEIVALELTSGDPATEPSYVKLKVPKDLPKNVESLPVIIVSGLDRETFPGDPDAEFNASDSIGYPVYVAIVVAGNQDQSADDDELPHSWREALIDNFIMKRFTNMPTGTSHLYTTIEPAPIIDPGAWSNNLILSAFVLRCVTKKRRRIS